MAAPSSEDCKDGHHEEQGHVVYSDGGGRHGHWGADRYYVTDQVHHIRSFFKIEGKGGWKGGAKEP